MVAIIKHVSGHNASYIDAVDYLIYQHHERSAGGKSWYEPVLDEFGLRQPREDCAIMSLTADGKEQYAKDWVSACQRTNLSFSKNASYQERKTHTYILSLPPEDREKATKQELLQVAKKLVRTFFGGYGVLITVHMDTVHPHVHIVLNSVRTLERQEQPWMMRGDDGQMLPCEVMAGGKHQDSPQLRRTLNDWVLEECRRRGWSEKDNNAIADARKRERYAEKHENLRELLRWTASDCQTIAELRKRLTEEHQVELRVRGHTVSVRPQGAKKAVRLKTLGLNPQELFAHMDDWEDEQMRMEEQKRYIEWVKQRREWNEAHAEEIQLKMQKIVELGTKHRGETYCADDYGALYDLLRQENYLAANLRTEVDKLDRLLRRWNDYEAAVERPAEREEHGKYLRWCGCDPDDKVEREYLETLLKTAKLRHNMTLQMSQALIMEAQDWKHHNQIVYNKKDLAWLHRREGQLKHQIKYYKKRCKKLYEISDYYERVAEERKPLAQCRTEIWKYSEEWARYFQYRHQWTEGMFRIKELEEKLEKIQQEKREAKRKKWALRLERSDFC